MLGGVPISVIMPPKIEAKDSGMRVSLGLRSALSAACRSIGISKASAATLFMMAESAAETPAITEMCRPILRVLSSKALAMNSMAPDR